MNDESSTAAGFWNRLSRRGKVVIVVDLLVLVAIIAIGATIVIRAAQDSSAPSGAEALPTTVPSTSTPAPFRSSHGLAWIVAACGGPMILDDLPQSPLPRAHDSGVCLIPGGPTMAIGVYDDKSTLNDDVTDVPGPHRYAIRTDGDGDIWMFLVEGDSAAPLKPLERYGFRVQ